MVDHRESLIYDYDLFVNNTLKFLDSTIERDYMVKLKIIDELVYQINEGKADKNIIKNKLKAIQDECSKLSNKLKASACMLDEVQAEKNKLELEKKTLKFQLKQVYSTLKQPDTTEIFQEYPSHSNHTNCNQHNSKRSFNNTEALLSDISYSHSEDSSNENVINNVKVNPILSKKYATSKLLNDNNSKNCKIKNCSNYDGEITAITTFTVESGYVNAKSVLKSQLIPTSKVPLKMSPNGSVESSNESEKESILLSNKNIDTGKEHKLVKEMTIFPKVCAKCHKKIKCNNYLIKCLDCKTIVHLKCKDCIPNMCTQSQQETISLNISPTVSQF